MLFFQTRAALTTLILRRTPSATRTPDGPRKWHNLPTVRLDITAVLGAEVPPSVLKDHFAAVESLSPKLVLEENSAPQEAPMPRPALLARTAPRALPSLFLAPRSTSAALDPTSPKFVPPVLFAEKKWDSPRFAPVAPTALVESASQRYACTHIIHPNPHTYI